MDSGGVNVAGPKGEVSILRRVEVRQVVADRFVQLDEPLIDIHCQLQSDQRLHG